MPTPTPLHLRQEIVDAYENGEGTYRELAEQFGVGEASVSRFLALSRYGGDLSPKKAGGDRRSAKALASYKAKQSVESLARD